MTLQAGMDPVMHFAICDTAGPIGGIGLIAKAGDLQHSAGVGYWLGKRFWGRGIATAALRVVTRYGFETLGLTRIEARVKTYNGASSRVLEKLGYAREGLLHQAVLKQGVPEDILIYGVLREHSRDRDL